jgi:hypothetical protein
MGRPKSTTVKTRLNNLVQASKELGIPFDQMRAIKKLYPDGFTSNGSIIRENVVTYYNAHQAEIEKMALDSLQALKEQKLKNDILLQEFEIEEAKKSVVAIADVEEFLKNLGIQIGAVLKAKMTKELPPHIVGLKEEDITRICKEHYNQLVELLQTNMDNWNGNSSKE